MTTLQLKFLKRVIGVSSSTANSFVFLELGVLPIEHEIAKRQIMYLQRILKLEDGDPVSEMFWNLKSLHEAGEKNWWTEVVTKMDKYNLDVDLEGIKKMSKGVFARKVNKRIMETAHAELLVECNSLTKTSGIQYHEFKTQDYLLKLFPGESRTIFKWRSRTLDVKCHLTYKYKDAICRRCKNADETPDHVINCGSDELIAVDDVTELNELDVEAKNRVKEQVQRIVTFIHEHSKGT